jgi:YHS domain-containing protein
MCAFIVVCLGLTSLAIGQQPGPAKSDSPARKEQTTCPVMGGKVDKSLYLDVDGKRIYVCCKGCIATLQKDPTKYIRKLESEGVAIESAPANTNAVKTAVAPAKAPGP